MSLEYIHVCELILYIRSASNSVFVGNIPYDATEDELANLFRQFGDVVKFRMMYDPATGKGKGYGFCDFALAESADSAKRMNNVLSLHGATLRVHSASQGQAGGLGTRSSAGSSHSLKQARDLDTALAQLSVGEVYDILVEVKTWVKKDPEAVRELLSQRPILAQALLKMQTTMGMLQTSPPADQSFGSFTASLNSSQSAQPALTPPPGGNVVQPAPSSLMPPSYLQPSYYAPLPYSIAAYPQQPMGIPMGQHASLPGLAGPPADEQDVLRRIMMMSEEDVMRLPPNEQAHVRAFRNNMARG